MANQTITVDSNHDDLTGRNAGEDITIQQGAILTVDSYPQETPRGILGDILLTEGDIHIDGRYVREVAYVSGTGTLPTVGTALTYGAAGTAKVINLNSGTNAAGVMTITIQGVREEPTGTLSGGGWSASVSTSRQGLLKVFGEDQVWDATNATCTLRITGDWYEIGTGTGADNQSITLPHTGHQHAIWVETGNGTNVFQIWHRVSTVASTVFWDSVLDWGDSYEAGFVFSCVPGSGVLDFGTATNGGAPPSGARIRIPSVHLGTTTVGAPQTEVTLLVLASYLEIIDSSVTQNVFIDHLNASSVQASLIQTNGATISDSVFGLWSAANFINRNNSEVLLTNCAFVSGNQLPGDSLAAGWIILDNVGGITSTDCVYYCGVNGNNVGTMLLTTMANLTFEGTNKVISNQQDENTQAAVRGNVASNIINNGTLLLVNGGVITIAGCVNWQLGDIAWGQLSARGNTENSLQILNLTGTDTVTIDSGRYLAGGGIAGFRGSQVILTDASNITIQNFGDIDAKLDNGGFGTNLLNLAGITNNVTLRRVWFTNLGSVQSLAMVNSASDILIENCSSDYDDEIETDATRVLIKGFHGASGNPGAATGVENDLVNCVATIFLDYFKSDTTGAIGLTFNDRGRKHLGDVEIVSGNPIWNGLGDMLMRSAGDQVIFTWPYFIKGHTGFANLAVQTFGVNLGNFGFEYDLDTGSGFSGSWQAVTGANVSAETISPAGFKIKIRITCLTSNLTNAIDGFAIRTTTTIAGQKANLYPADSTTLTLTSLQPGSEVRVYAAGTQDEVAGVENSGTSQVFQLTVPSVDIVVHALSYEYLSLTGVDTSINAAIPIQQRFDRYYSNT
jgi:hypothetical protein